MNSLKLTILTIVTLSAIRTTTSKVYRRCELAKELRDIYGIPENQLATWICIIGHESSYNTSAISDGAESYGLFQISREYWCLPNGRGCGVSCSALRDDDIRDDVECAKRIFGQHQRIAGDGFKAWTMYTYRCKTNVEKYIRDCYEGGLPNSYYVERKPQQPSFSTIAPEISSNKPSYFSKPKFRSYYVPEAPAQISQKSYYKIDKDFVYKTEKIGYTHKWNWSWSSKHGFQFNETYY